MLRAPGVGAWLLAAGLASAQSAEAPAPAREPGPIQDNSFLVEEAYNQEPGVVQHIQQFTWVPSSGTWAYTFTQEWPVGGIKNQLSYTLAAARVTGGAAATTGFGDVLLNYRYQLVGDGEAPVAVAPRLSVLLPTGSARRQLGAGGAGVQVALPVSVVLSNRFYLNGNAGATWVPRAQNALGQRAGTIGYNFGASLIWRGSNTLDLMLETVWACAETPSGPGRVQSGSSWLISPGARWAFNFPSGLQIVPGIGVPIGVGPSHDRSVLVYLSFEHPFVKASR
jgi:hypothetical protein